VFAQLIVIRTKNRELWLGSLNLIIDECFDESFVIPFIIEYWHVSHASIEDMVEMVINKRNSP